MERDNLHRGLNNMDETMRRSDRKLTDEETLRLFHVAEYGVLSLIDGATALLVQHETVI